MSARQGTELRKLREELEAARAEVAALRDEVRALLAARPGASRPAAVRMASLSATTPMPSGISDYSFELLPLIAERADVDVVCPKVGSRWRRDAPLAPADIPVVDPSEFAARAARYDAVVYHLGNNPAHKYVFDEAMRRPGIAVFHDFTMHHLIDWMYWGPPRRDLRGYREAVSREVGPELGGRLAALHATDVVTNFEVPRPLNGKLGPRLPGDRRPQSRRRQIREIAPGVPVTVIPHHAGRPPDVEGVTREEARAAFRRAPSPHGPAGYITRPRAARGAVVGSFAETRRHGTTRGC